MSKKFQLDAPYKPAGDQPRAITEVTEGLKAGKDKQTLLGVTGSGKTYVMANIIAQTQKPALIISHNKTLTAQLAEEFREFFPENAVSYFVSYYDYYQPEAYIPRTDTYIAKDSSINDEIDRLRHATMENVLLRNDVVVVASVSCIYGLGAPVDYLEMRLEMKVGEKMDRQEILKKLAQLQYERNDTDLTRGKYRVRGDIIDIHPAGEDQVLRIEAFGPQIERLSYIDGLTGETLREVDAAAIFPATFFISDKEKTAAALDQIRAELKERLQYFKKRKKLVEAQRLEERTMYDLEMIEQLGYVSGVENYSRYMDGRKEGEPPSTLIDYFIHSYGKDGFLTFIDESHITVPQIGGMHAGDRARKEQLVRYGFRLPSALDNRPLKFSEFEKRVDETIFVSATPADYEHNKSKQTVELIVRPTGLLDPEIDIRPTKNQVDDVMDEIQEEIKKGHRVLVTTLTKRMAEELATYLVETGTKAAYLHGEVDTLERVDILRDLRAGRYDVLVGINLLREGLDLPEVALVAIMDADKEGYLRSASSLIQIMGRGARHAEGRVIMYADNTTGSMQKAIDETDRRRKIQQEYNQAHNITPKSIVKAIKQSSLREQELDDNLPDIKDIPAEEKHRVIKELEKKMDLAARNLEFEKAAELRDFVSKLRKKK